MSNQKIFVFHRIINNTALEMSKNIKYKFLHTQYTKYVLVIVVSVGEATT